MWPATPKTTPKAKAPTIQGIRPSPMPLARTTSTAMGGAVRARDPATALPRPKGRRMKKATGSRLATTVAGTSTDKTLSTSTMRAMASRLSPVATSRRLPSRTRAASSSSKGRTLRGS